MDLLAAGIPLSLLMDLAFAVDDEQPLPEPPEPPEPNDGAAG